MKTGRLTEEQQAELEKRLAERMPSERQTADRRLQQSPAVRPATPAPAPRQYNPVGTNTAATTYKGGCGTCGRNISYG